LLQYTPTVALNTFTKTVFDMTFDHHYGHMFHTISSRAMDMILLDMIRPWRRNAIAKLFLWKEKAYLRQWLVKIADKVIERILPEFSRVSQKHSSPEDGDDDDDETKSKSRMEVFYNVSEQGKNIDVRLNSEIISLLAGGTDTSSIMMAFLLLTMGIHKDIQDKAYAELQEIFGDSDRDATEDDLKSMIYLEQCIKETLRRFTLVPVLIRGTESEVKIGKYVYPEGVGIFVLASAVHFNPEFYPDPWKFNPDHFTPEAIARRPKNSFIAFSAGVRICIGHVFGMMEMKVILSTLLRKYAFHSNVKDINHLNIHMGFITNCLDGFKVTIKPRKL